MGINNSANRATKKATRTRQQRRRAARGQTPGTGRGEGHAGPGTPDPALLDTTHCPIAETCQGCGAGDDVRAVTAAFNGGAEDYDVACASLCPDCDGRSFLHLLAPDELNAAVERHTAHASTGA